MNGEAKFDAMVRVWEMHHATSIRWASHVHGNPFLCTAVGRCRACRDAGVQNGSPAL